MLGTRLRSQIDQYPFAYFEVLLLLGQEQRVLALAEMIPSLEKQAKVWSLILRHLRNNPQRSADYEVWLARFQQWVSTASDQPEKASALIELAYALVNATLSVSGK